MDIPSDGSRTPWDPQWPRRPEQGARDSARTVRESHVQTSFIGVLNRPGSQEITLSTGSDPFFQSNYLATFGDLGGSLKDYVQDYQARSMAQSPSSINSIADMKRFVEEYPEFRKLGGNVSKHVALVGELSRLVGRDKLLEVGEVEQGLATSSGADLKVCYLQKNLHGDEIFN